MNKITNFSIIVCSLISALSLISCGKSEPCPPTAIVDSGEYTIEYDFSDEYSSSKLTVSYKNGKVNLSTDSETELLYISDGKYILNKEEKTYSDDESYDDFSIYFWGEGQLKFESAQETDDGVQYVCTCKYTTYKFLYQNGGCVQIDICREIDGKEVHLGSPKVTKFSASVSEDTLFEISSEYTKVSESEID